MPLLITGVLLFAVIHLIPVVKPQLRTVCVSKLGLLPYKTLFAVLSLGCAGDDLHQSTG